MKYSFFQVPLILRADWNVENIINFDIFAGMGYNIPLKATAALAEIEGGPTAAYSATITIPPSVMVGGGIGTNFGESVVLYMDFRGTFDIAETKVKLADGRASAFTPKTMPHTGNPNPERRTSFGVWR
ncbi:MAG: hypothetical protein LBJ86_05815 [Spirochaetaceae bacterium]|jgi:hypothetical protein|nr:hypothetical protein [Spirochaetaceae bacterium]